MQANEERRHAGSRFLPAVTHAENGRSDQGVVVATSLTRPTFIIRARRLVLLSSAQGASRRGSPMPWMSWQLADAPDGRGMNVRAPLAAPRQASEDSEKRGPVCPPSWYSTCGQAKRQMRHEQGVRAWTSCHRGAVEPQPSQPPSAVSSHASGSGSRASAGTWRWWPYELIDDVDLRMCRRARPSLRQSRQGKRWTPVRWVSRIGVDDTRRQNDRSSAVVWLPAFAFAFAFVRAYWYRVMSRSSTAPQSITVCNGRLAADGSGDATGNDDAAETAAGTAPPVMGSNKPTVRHSCAPYGHLTAAPFRLNPRSSWPAISSHALAKPGIWHRVEAAAALLCGPPIAWVRRRGRRRWRWSVAEDWGLGLRPRLGSAPDPETPLRPHRPHRDYLGATGTLRCPLRRQGEMGESLQHPPAHWTDPWGDAVPARARGESARRQVPRPDDAAAVRQVATEEWLRPPGPGTTSGAETRAERFQWGAAPPLSSHPLPSLPPQFLCLDSGHPRGRHWRNRNRRRLEEPSRLYPSGPPPESQAPSARPLGPPSCSARWQPSQPTQRRRPPPPPPGVELLRRHLPPARRPSPSPRTGAQWAAVDTVEKAHSWSPLHYYAGETAVSTNQRRRCHKSAALPIRSPFPSSAASLPCPGFCLVLPFPSIPHPSTHPSIHPSLSIPSRRGGSFPPNPTVHPPTIPSRRLPSLGSPALDVVPVCPPPTAICALTPPHTTVWLPLALLIRRPRPTDDAANHVPPSPSPPHRPAASLSQPLSAHHDPAKTLRSDCTIALLPATPGGDNQSIRLAPLH
ncbi:hypothetical protein Purlil1_6966 [Purpureocillium lilacinum]|uniref:Uncharacterized protein n=1 Tax=Purpureocillium lilacinum TaxID=33203 RepID=A0ABR0BXQ2_PURLI|nr:hypothetical protein Purlil1_6966 [Purpureocillium lilacinum]